ncbi:hypothetical protein [Nonomuraea aurantiaca]|uniref:hypothetical protein n=1 Tax=Nonomuraea aurantiaca TaxID=2878562 RepID=UPI001CD94FCE|nr:hypothetical protein [Nonomuraea aurantiaca]MCA2229471.1 hypothetical protein [Nonomuraea aurantiaca]
MVPAGTCEPPANTPFPPYYGIQIMTKLGAGDLVRLAAVRPRGFTLNAACTS